jgi:hypothetical protein
MTVNLTIPIECGEDTCSRAKGHFCKFQEWRVDGTKPRCTLFEKPLFDEAGGINGWLLRCKQCKEAEK